MDRTPARSSKGAFDTEQLCTTGHKHQEWNIDESQHVLKRMRDLPGKLVGIMCEKGGISLTSKQRQQRRLLFCTGCLAYVEHETQPHFQQEFTTFVKKQKMSPEMVASDSEPDISFSHEDTINPETIETESDSVLSDAFKHENTQTVNTIIDVDDYALDLSILTSVQRQNLAFALGASERENIHQINQSSTQDYKSMSFWTNFDLTKYHDQQNNVVKSFLHGLRWAPSPVQTYRTAKTVETIIDHCCVNTVQPLHFLESLVLYCMTRSKIGLKMLSAQTPHASYDTIKRWLGLLSTQIRIQRPIGDIVLVIDNNQVLKKKWAIRIENRCYSSVVTMVVAFEIDKEGHLEEQEDLSPSYWRNLDLTSEQITKLKYIDADSNAKHLHYEQLLFPYLSSRIAKVIGEQSQQGDKWIDLVDEKVEYDRKKENYKICGVCEQENNKTNRKCNRCGESLSQSQTKRSVERDEPRVLTKNVSETRLKATVEGGNLLKLSAEKQQRDRPEYAHIKCDNSGDKPNVFVLTPTMVNPNSYDAIQQVLLDVGMQSEIHQYCPESDRQFVLVYCDGVPYNLIWRVCNSTMRCSDCDVLLHSKKDCDKHIHDNFNPEFDWVIVVPGGGHIEMNMLKALVDLLWPVFWKDMVMLFNFTSETALRSARSVSDHHKGWTILSICRNALVDELLVPFIRQELHDSSANNSSTLNVSPKTYFKFLDSGTIKDPNYLFLVDATFELMDSIFMFRAGIRSGRSDLIWAGRAKFSKVWSGRHHPAYRELNAHDMMQRMLLPDQLGDFLDRTMSLNMSGAPYTGEGPDFRLEEVNKGVQSFLPLVPTNEDWQRVCANYTTLNSLRGQLLAYKGCNVASTIYSAKPAQESPNEELAVRAMFRKNNYLNDPTCARDHVSVSGVPLNPSLATFCKQAAKNHAELVDQVLIHHRTSGKDKPCAVRVSFNPVCITKEEQDEFSKLEKRTCAELEIIIDTMLLNIENDEFREPWVELWEGTIKRKVKKIEYLEFIQEIEDFLTFCNNSLEIEDSDEGEDSNIDVELSSG